MPASDFNIGGVEGQIAALNTQIAMISESIQSNFNVVRFGRVVYLSCVGGSFNKDAENHITNSSNVVIRIPNGYRPVANAELWDCNGEKRITVDTDGYLASSASISSSALRFSGCWITNNAMPS